MENEFPTAEIEETRKRCGWRGDAEGGEGVKLYRFGVPHQRIHTSATGEDTKLNVLASLIRETLCVGIITTL